MNGVQQQQRIEIKDITQVPKPQESTAVQPRDASIKRNKIYIRSVRGKIENLRRYTGLYFLLMFLALPWLQYNGKQAILLDFVQQKLHFFSLTLWPQDLTILAWLFIVAAFALFFVTAIWGRVWCGFMCPQTVFTFLFVWIEEKTEGARNKRIHLDQQSMSKQKVLKKGLKHSLWLAVSALTAITFVGYFTPIKPLLLQLSQLNIDFWTGFYIVLFTACTYGNAGWLREIMCTHICPYSRFQSSMFDDDTYTATYNAYRGEGRGPRPKRLSQQQYKSKGLGDCIDCNLCVQVCPTGIDIRNGLQYECINCGACVDACNGVMAKMGYESGLISYTSASNLKQTDNQAVNHKQSSLLRPKVIGYFAVLLVMTGLLIDSVVNLAPLDLNVIRDRNILYRETPNGNIENVYTLVVMNKTQSAQQVTLSTEGLSDAKIRGEKVITIEPNQLVKHPITIDVNASVLNERITPFQIKVMNSAGEIAISEATFFGR
ncbi:cytochrome c oxidase accessory protein CcoG [Planctobacterium marinum]|uniref:Cytochrome c oxidase accessory protein CcoG n=1 Tax=Planctobacterium marinum TaxID=1631968 RepID=A0AA48KQL3_9ALTE|nr:cytochrome c oxidase accessory protein CcoG [Planctobacterium marinum]